MSVHYTKLSLNERIQIQTLYDTSLTVRAIARTVRRAPSTISRELARNRHCPAQRGSQSTRRIQVRSATKKMFKTRSCLRLGFLAIRLCV
jgi:IS30 family transposase